MYNQPNYVNHPSSLYTILFPSGGGGNFLSVLIYTLFVKTVEVADFHLPLNEFKTIAEEQRISNPRHPLDYYRIQQGSDNPDSQIRYSHSRTRQLLSQAKNRRFIVVHGNAYTWYCRRLFAIKNPDLIHNTDRSRQTNTENDNRTQKLQSLTSRLLKRAGAQVFDLDYQTMYLDQESHHIVDFLRFLMPWEESQLEFESNYFATQMRRYTKRNYELCQIDQYTQKYQRQ